MENIRKHLFSSSPGGTGSGNARMEGRSVFHTKLVSGPADLGECLAGIREYIGALGAFCGAGTHLGSLLSASLHETAYAEIAGRFHATCTEIEAAVCKEGSDTQREIECLWSQLGRRPTSKEVENNNVGEDIQLVARCFARILQLHCQFFLSSSEALAEFNNLRSLDDLHTDKSESTCDVSQTEPDWQNISSNEIGKSKSNSGSKESIQSPSGIRRQITSFLSKIGKASNTSGSSHSAFYVDAPLSDGTAIDRPLSLGGVGDSSSSVAAGSGAGAALGQSFSSPAGQASQEEQFSGNNAKLTETDAGTSVVKQVDNVPLAAGPTPVPAPRTHKSAAQHQAAGNGAQLPNIAMVPPQSAEVASQEELDNVIDFLSGCPKLSSTAGVEGIAAPPPTQAPLSKAVGGHLPTQNVFMPNTPMNIYGNQQRAGDGYGGENLSREAKTHTWPYRPASRPPGGQVSGVPGSYSMFGDGYGGMDTDYTNYLSSVKQMQQGMTMPPPPLPPHLPPGPQMLPPTAWSSGDGVLNKSWHGWYGAGNEQSGVDNVVRHWSTLGDSSSCSDESSNGEVPWMMMGLDLNAGRHKRYEISVSQPPKIIALNSCVLSFRRHSSGEEGFHHLSNIPIGVEAQHRPHSVEDLLEPKSTNTWPPKQPWAKGPPPTQPLSSANQRHLPGSCDPSGVDRGLHAQLGVPWNDPNLNRQQTTWASGMVAALSGQAINNYSNLPPGGTNMENLQHSKLERKYSVLT